MIKVNLLSPEKKDIAGGAEAVGLMDEERENKINVPVAVVSAAVTLLIIGGMYFLQSRTVSRQERTLAERRARKVELDGILKTLDQLERTKKDLDRKVKIISDLKARQDVAIIMMDQLSRALPDWVWLSKLRFNGNSLDLNGKALSNNLIADFINNLQSTNYFYKIELKSSILGKQAGLDIFKFKIICQFKKTNNKKAG